MPLVGGTVLLSRAQLRSSLRQAAKSQSGVPIRLPKATDRCTVLLCVADETPGFVLAYLNAGQNCIHLLAVPAALEVPFGGKNVPLADCYTAAGPARCREALGEVFALPEDTDYLAIAPAVLTKLAARYGAVRVGFTGALTPEQLARYGKGTGVQGISAADAHSFLAALDADTSLSPRRSAAARAAVCRGHGRRGVSRPPGRRTAAHTAAQRKPRPVLWSNGTQNPSSFWAKTRTDPIKNLYSGYFHGASSAYNRSIPVRSRNVNYSGG